MPDMTNKTTRGPVGAVPCPHCGKPNDLSEVVEMMGGGAEPGLLVDCDHCGRFATVAQVSKVTVIHLRQAQGQRGAGGQAVAAAPAAKPGFFARLLGAPPKR